MKWTVGLPLLLIVWVWDSVILVGCGTKGQLSMLYIEDRLCGFREFGFRCSSLFQRGKRSDAVLATFSWLCIQFSVPVYVSRVFSEVGWRGGSVVEWRPSFL